MPSTPFRPSKGKPEPKTPGWGIGLFGSVGSAKKPRALPAQRVNFARGTPGDAGFKSASNANLDVGNRGTFDPQPVSTPKKTHQITGKVESSPWLRQPQARRSDQVSVTQNGFAHSSLPKPEALKPNSRVAPSRTVLSQRLYDGKKTIDPHRALMALQTNYNAGALAPHEYFSLPAHVTMLLGDNQHGNRFASGRSGQTALPASSSTGQPQVERQDVGPAAKEPRLELGVLQSTTETPQQEKLSARSMPARGTPYPHTRKLDQVTAAADETPKKRARIVGQEDANEVTASLAGHDMLEQLPPAGDSKVPAVMNIFKKIEKRHPRKHSGDIVSLATPSMIYGGAEYSKSLAKANEDVAAKAAISAQEEPSSVDNWICTNETCKALNYDSTAWTCRVCGANKGYVTHKEGWGTLFSSKPKTWKCQACLAQNNMDLVKCPACETPRDGVTNNLPGGTNSVEGAAPAASAGSIGAGGFTFQVPTPNNSSIGSTGFFFGGAAGSSSQPASSPPPSKAPFSGGFTFAAPTGATPAAATPSVQAPQASEINGKIHQSLTKPAVNGDKPTFSFGVAPSASKSGGENKSTPGSFSFGFGPAPTTSEKPMFGNSGENSGQKASGTSEVGTSEAPKNLFTFGVAAATTTPSTDVNADASGASTELSTTSKQARASSTETAEQPRAKRGRSEPKSESSQTISPADSKPVALFSFQNSAAAPATAIGGMSTKKETPSFGALNPPSSGGQAGLPPFSFGAGSATAKESIESTQDGKSTGGSQFGAASQNPPDGATENSTPLTAIPKKTNEGQEKSSVATSSSTPAPAPATPGSAFVFGSTTKSNEEKAGAGSAAPFMVFGAKSASSQSTTTNTMFGSTTGATATAPSVASQFGSAPAAADPNLGSTTASTALTFGSAPAPSGPSFGTTPAPAAPSFGSASAPSGPSFGTTPAPAAPSFGSTPAPSGPSFGTTPAPAAPAFGSAPAPAAPAFGSTPAPAAPAFGSAPTPAAPAFGSTPAPAAPAFGSAPTPAAPAFGTASAPSGPNFGGTPAPSGPNFGSTSASSATGFGSASVAAPAFGSAPAATTNALGQSAPMFGQASTAPFGQSGSQGGFGAGQSFGTPAPASGGFVTAFGGNQAPVFGNSTPAPAPSGGGGGSFGTPLFGQPPASGFGNSGAAVPGSLGQNSAMGPAGAGDIQFSLGSGSVRKSGTKGRRLVRAKRPGNPSRQA